MESLRVVMRLNGASCLAFGAVMLLAPRTTAEFLGTAPSWLIVAIGTTLLLNGAHLLFAAARGSLKRLEVLYFTVGDLLWVTATLLLVGSGVFISTTEGAAASLVVAAGVGALGLMQVYLITRATSAFSEHDDAHADDHLPPGLSLSAAIATSWMSLKTRVKVWLIVLNAIFLAGIAFWPDPVATVSLAAYVASGPWLAAFMIAQRGLTRLLGLAHLIPWTPLLIYLVLRLTGGLAGTAPHSSSALELDVYAVALSVAVTACLLLDAFDVWRWMNGERFRFGSRAAVRAGASLLSRAAIKPRACLKAPPAI